MNVEQTDVGANKWMNKVEKVHLERANLVMWQEGTGREAAVTPRKTLSVREGGWAAIVNNGDDIRVILPRFG